ncbi:MAG: transglycosylase domain-containing protein, partial [Pseudomonadota bacterium]
MQTLRRILIPVAALAAAFTVAATAGVIGAYHFAFPGLPPAETIRDIPLQVPLRVYSRDGLLISEIGEQRRLPVDYDEIPEVVVQALLAAEDDRFYDHPGVDYQGVLRAAWILLTTGSRSQGGSTITMQLARDYFLGREREFTRKVREIFLAYRIEKQFSKNDILAMFLNKMFFGQRAYGIAAAAQVFFDKRLDELNAAEAATLVGVLAAPSRYNPVSGPEASKLRRGYVLRRMRELDFLTDDEYRDMMDYPLESELHGPDVELNAPYVAEMVRRDMLERFGDDIYEAGYSVTTTLDSRLQSAAVNALRNGLLEYDRRHGYRGVLGRVDLDEGALPDPDAADVRQALLDYPEYGGLRTAVVQAVNAERNSAQVLLRRGESVVVPWSGIDWAEEYIDDNTVGPAIESAGEVLSPGDIVYVIPTVDGNWALAQRPAAEGAFVALDPDDGAIVALHGGFDFTASKFNRAVQIKRQPGSTFKP